MKEKGISAVSVILWISVILWMAVIFMFSAQNSGESSGISLKITDQIAEIIIPSFNGMSLIEKTKIIDNLHYFIRKTAHAGAYFIFGILCILLMNTYKIKNYNKIIISLIICLVYAFSDELHQAFVPGRGPSVYDVGIDFCGSFIGVFIISLLIKLHNNFRRKSEKRRIKHEEPGNILYP
jgi:VanZ family protein